MAKIAIVSFEFEDLTKNGGVGTAYRRLAEALVAKGHGVTIFFMPAGQNRHEILLAPSALKKMKLKMRKVGVELVCPEFTGMLSQMLHMPYYLRRSLLVYHFLRSQNFAIIHAPDSGGLVYYSLCAKKLGLDFHDSQFVIGAHGSSLWTSEANQESTAQGILSSGLDRQSIEMADWLVSPSRYMLKYLTENSWKMPRSTVIIPNVNMIQKAPVVVRKSSVGKIESIVFFGRLEKRKGFFLFIQSLIVFLKKNEDIGANKTLNIFFLGKTPENMEKIVPKEIRRLKVMFKKRIRVQVLGKLSSEQSLRFLRSMSKTLVCMPSLMDNSPYVIVESMQNGLDFLSTNVGGQAELIHPADHQEYLVTATKRAFAAAIEKRFKQRPRPARPSILAECAKKKWLQFHQQCLKVKVQQISAVSRKEPLVSIILVGAKGGVSHQQRIIKSIRQQTFTNVEVCVSDDWDLTSPLFHNLKIKRIPTSRHESLLSSAIKASSGKYILALGGPEFFSSVSLQTWVKCAEFGIQSSNRTIGVSGFTELFEDKNSDVMSEVWSVPLPDEHGMTLLSRSRVVRCLRLSQPRRRKILRKLDLPLLAVELHSKGWKKIDCPQPLLRWIQRSKGR